MTLTSAWLWPDVSVRRFAQNAIQEAVWAAALVSVLTALLAVVALLRPSDDSSSAWPGLVVSAIYVALAFGIHKRSRVSATLAFLLFTSDSLYIWIQSGPKGLFLRTLFMLAFFHGIRGCFAYRKLPSRPADAPSIEDSFRSMNQPPSPQA